MARTYLTQLVKIVKTLCTYINRYGALIVPILDSPEKEIFLALQASCTAFMNSSIVTQAKND